MNEHIEALHAAITAVPEGEREYVVRFVSKNAHLSPEELATKWRRDRADREEAAAIQRHRDEKVLEDFRELISRKGDAVAAVTGVQAEGEAAEATN